MSFPVHLLRKDDAVLSLFVAGFHGAQDLVPIRDAGCVNVIAVDRDAEKLDVMRPRFPGYVLHAGDAFTFLDVLDLRNDRKFDVVTADPWTGGMEPKMVEVLPRLLQHTARVLVVGFTPKFLVENGAVEAALTAYSARTEHTFETSIIERTKAASWLVVEFPEV